MKKPASIRLTPNQVSIVRLGRALLDSQIEAAEQRGYIRRVHEIESRPAPAVAEGILDPDAVAKLGRIVAYSPEKEASAILDVISPELLERVLGKPDVPRDE